MAQHAQLAAAVETESGVTITAGKITLRLDWMSLTQLDASDFLFL